MTVPGRIVPGLAIVAAMAANRVIGRGGQLPWHLPADLRHFKTLTVGHPVIMGRRTFESIHNKPLPARRNIVVSTTSNPIEGAEIARSLEEALELVKGCAPVFVVGGSVLYAAALSCAQFMYLTELDEPVDGDTYFPEFDKLAWKLIRETRHDRDERHAIAFRICLYEKCA
jgi:dihydrofolate reductase